MVRIIEERTNEFGISYAFTKDEFGDEWKIKKSGIWMRPENAYYMMIDTEQIAVEPLLFKTKDIGKCSLIKLK